MLLVPDNNIIYSNAGTARSMHLVMHIVFKVAKAMAPAVVFIDNVEKIFMKAKKKAKKEGKAPVSSPEAGSGEEHKKGVADVAVMMRKELLAQIARLRPGLIISFLNSCSLFVIFSCLLFVFYLVCTYIMCIVFSLASSFVPTLAPPLLWVEMEMATPYVSTCVIC